VARTWRAGLEPSRLHSYLIVPRCTDLAEGALGFSSEQVQVAGSNWNDARQTSTAQRKISVRVAHPAQHSAKRRGERGERRESGARKACIRTRAHERSTSRSPRNPKDLTKTCRHRSCPHSSSAACSRSSAVRPKHIIHARGQGGHLGTSWSSWSDARATGAAHSVSPGGSERLRTARDRKRHAALDQGGWARGGSATRRREAGGH
jgi:hypothetical protein